MKKRGFVSQEIADVVLERAGGVCENCGKETESGEIHHIAPWIEATPENLIYLCFDCHRGTNGCHGRDGAALALKIRIALQEKYYSQGYNRDEVRKLMGGKIYIRVGK